MPANVSVLRICAVYGCRVLTALVLILSSFMSDPVLGQGFQILNDRNHPQIDWEVAETEHFRIIYPDYLEDLIPEAAAVAEESYEVLSANFGIEFEHRIRIYLSDSDEISNGFVVPVGNGHTNIWVNLNEYAEIWTGNQKWLQKVIPHELAHIFHFQAIRTPLGLLNYVIANPIQLAWTEGLAQYQTERWDSERGDRWLRLAIFDSRPDYNDRSWLYNRRLMYAVGHSQVRYFAEVYGDSSLTAMFAYRDTFAGLVQTHDFERSFRETAGISYREFREEWHKHMNIYYNTLASQMERIDSLSANTENLPGRYFYDVSYSPDRSQIAVLSLPTMQRAQRRLYLVRNDSTRNRQILADGNIRRGIDWSPCGKQLVYSRRVRGESGSLLHDLFLYDTEIEKERPLTVSRRAFYPAYSPDGERLAFVANEGGTANIFLMDPESGGEVRLTDYEGNIQLITLVWNHPRNELVYQRFDQNGMRNLIRLNPDTGEKRVLDRDEGEIDNRWPLVSPDGNRIAFTSLRDEVSNLFMYDLESDSTWRVTRLFTGADGFDWITDVESEEERILLRATESKRSESIYAIGANRRADGDDPAVPASYGHWRMQTPPNVLTESVEPDEGLIRNRYSYNSWENLTHGVSLATPYYAGWDRYGVAGFTSWLEPLGKHMLVAGGALSVNDPSSSEGFLAYQNRQLEPSLLFSLYRLPLRFYGHRLMVERRTGADLSARWPVNRLETSWRRSWFGVRAGYYHAEPYMAGGWARVPLTPEPVSGSRLSLRLAWGVKQTTPFYRNRIHPLDGYGVQVSVTGSERWFGSDVSMLAADVQGYLILPGPGLHRLVLFGRLQAQSGDPFPQDRIGFSRGDKLSMDAPFEFSFMRSYLNERVRGYRSYLGGDRVAFMSAEYRIPFINSLETQLLGLVELGTTSLVLFADAGTVGGVTLSDTAETKHSRLGLGTEVKNLIRIGPVSFVHSLGVAQPYNGLFDRDFDLYYRIQASVPF